MTPIDINGTLVQLSNAGVSVLANNITGFNINANNFPVLANRPYFSVQGTGTASWTGWNSTWTNIIFNSEIVDNMNCFNTSTYAFTAPVSGTYYFEAHSYVQKSPSTNADSYTHPIFRINDSYTYRQASYTTPYRLRTRTYYSSTYSTDTIINDIFYLAAGDYVHFHTYAGGNLIYYPPYGLFSGFFIG